MFFTPEQVIIIGLVATVVVFVVSTLSQQLGWTPNREVLTIGVYVVSFGLAVVFNPQALPAFPAYTDPSQFSTALIAYLGVLLSSLSSFAGIATLIYNVLLKKVLEGLATKIIPGQAQG